MRNLIQLFAIIISFLISSCAELNQTETVLLEDLEFNSMFADNKKDSVHTYCLLWTGYFRTPTSKNSDSLIGIWLRKHPNAKVIPVATHGPTLDDYPDSKMTYFWLIDGKDTINNFLIKNGCFPGGTMTRSNSKEVVDQETLHITEKTYTAFLNQIIEAEKFARQNKLGIWSEVNGEDE